MSDSRQTGLVQTVLGTVPPETLGPTTTHEHLLIDFSSMFRPHSDSTQRSRGDEPISMENLGWIRYNHYSHRKNLLLLDEETAIAEASLYKGLGGGAIVEATTAGIGRNPIGLERIARATGLNIVMGAGYYVDAVHPADMSDRTESDLAEQIVRELTIGVDDTEVKAGVIGEIGCTWPLTPNERKVLRASARAQQQTGAAILIHPGRDEGAPAEILDVLAEAGGDVGRTIMGHLDRTIADVDVLLELAQRGCYLEYDLFGFETSYYSLSKADMLSDAQRLDFIQSLIAEGHGNRIVVAQDICHNHRLVRYGGHGYGYILENVVPRMRERGITSSVIHGITVANPARVLAFA